MEASCAYLDRALRRPRYESHFALGSELEFPRTQLVRGLKHGQDDMRRKSRPSWWKTDDFYTRKFDAESNEGEIHRRRKIDPTRQIVCYHSMFFIFVIPVRFP